MLPILEFAFRGFWTWLGCLVMLWAVCAPAAWAIANFRLASWRYVMKRPKPKELKRLINEGVEEFKTKIHEQVEKQVAVIYEATKNTEHI